MCLPPMKHIIQISTETIKALNARNEQVCAITKHNETISTFLSPSGRAKKGCAEHVATLNVQHDEMDKTLDVLKGRARNFLRQDVTDYNKGICRSHLERMCEYSTEGDMLSIVRAALDAFNTNTKQTISIGNSMMGYSFDFDVYCGYYDSNGLCINITNKDEGRSFGGGVVCVRRNETFDDWKKREERFSVVTQYFSDAGDTLIVDVPPSYTDGGYSLSFDNQRECSPDYAIVAARLIQAASHICRDLAGSMRVEAMNNAPHNVVGY